MRRKKRRKNSSLKNIAPAIACILLAILLAVICLKWIRYKEAKFTRYAEFGIALPDNYIIHGIDVSRYQQAIAWDEVKHMSVRKIKMGFAFIKATEGENDVDPNFKKNWRAARYNKVTRGAYHFFSAYRNPSKQALNFIKNVSLLPGDLPPVLDVELLVNATPEQLLANVKIWLRIIEEHYKVKPIIYTNADFYNRYLGKDFDSYPLWVAHYYEQHKPRIKRPWTFWQHNDRGNVNGIVPKVDFNVFNGDSADFELLLVK